MNRLKPEKQRAIIACLVEGNSIRATSRMTGAAKGTVLKLLADVGQVCSDYQDEHLRNLECMRIQCDEIWSFCYSKKKNVPDDKRGQFGYGDVWTWTAICEDSKLVPSWHVGNQEEESAIAFISDLQKRMNNRLQLTTDGNTTYIDAVWDAFGDNIDYMQLQKAYGVERNEQGKYSPQKCTGIKKEKMLGFPNLDKANTSYVERQNLTMRMGMRRFTRLTNGFSKKVENLAHSVALHFMYYNFVRIHQTLKITPAMAAGVTDKLWELEDIVNLLNTYKKQ